MTVCRFYQQGNCRYGNACKFEHPPKGGQQQQGYGQNYGRFGALLNTPSNQGMNQRASDTPQYPGLTPDAVQRDLMNELPTWILSCYGPGKDAPEQLFGGYPREQSFEEIRLHFMQGAMAGNPAKALDDIQMAYNSAQEQIKHALSNIPAAIQYIIDGANKHPNRIDICKGQTGGGAMGSAPNAFQNAPAPALNPFGAPAASAAGASAFGQPAALGQKPSPFGAPVQPSAFGQPTQPAGSAFGQPSTMGAQSAFGNPTQPASTFGQPAALGAKPNPFGAPAFGQPAQSAGGPAFGQSAFGQTATLGPKPSPFGAPAAAPSPFGAPTTTTQPVANPFGQPAQQAQTSAFGQPAQQTQAPSPFGQPAQQTQTPSPFGQTGPVVPPSNNPFGQPATSLGQPPQSANPFGNAPASVAAPANPFGQPAPQNASPFGASAAAPAPANPFGQPAATASTIGGSSMGGATPAATDPENSPYAPNATRQHPPITSYSAREGNNRLRMFKGKPVAYELPKGASKEVPVIRNFDGSSTKIWNPDGAPKYTNYTEAEDDKKYEDQGVQSQWKKFVETGGFGPGGMPEVPPKREFCLWDF